MGLRTLFSELVYRSALALDAGDFAAFLALCAPELRYSIGAHSPELRRPMTWLDLDRAGLATLFETLPRHHSDRARLARHVTVYTVELREEEAELVSSLQVWRTALDGGATQPFAVGKIRDRARLIDGAPLLTRRHVELETRELGIGSHVPF